MKKSRKSVGESKNKGQIFLSNPLIINLSG